MEGLSRISALVGVAVLVTACSSAGDPVLLPRQSLPPIAAVDNPEMTLAEGVTQLSTIGADATYAYLGTVKAGSLHVLVKCVGAGVTAVRVSAIPGVFTVPCGPTGEISDNTIVLDQRERDVSVRLNPKAGQTVEALIGWDSSREKPPGFDDSVKT